MEMNWRCKWLYVWMHAHTVLMCENITCPGWVCVPVFSSRFRVCVGRPGCCTVCFWCWPGSWTHSDPQEPWYCCLDPSGTCRCPGRPAENTYTPSYAFFKLNYVSEVYVHNHPIVVKIHSICYFPHKSEMVSQNEPFRKVLQSDLTLKQAPPTTGNDLCFISLAPPPEWAVLSLPHLCPR